MGSFRCHIILPPKQKTSRDLRRFCLLNGQNEPPGHQTSTNKSTLSYANTHQFRIFAIMSLPMVSEVMRHPDMPYAHLPRNWLA
jgi:hypothetical protein